eukprot:CAMPEP_0119558286 /NCGR_PEP_ID=MMETSP1352-20130426/10534_1 /TAXON_ID=265584 /ORGANISM="Stauroneis constricta, Strain CCMP1120" /LENGTH=544 /DNA_ID=CAMNT_0007605601 /DNA_START=35 /DNA_END=1669 /DNA_ORIENTATION=-
MAMMTLPTPTATRTSRDLAEPLLVDARQNNSGRNGNAASQRRRNQDDGADEEGTAASPNVALMKLFTLVAFAGRSIWNQNVLSTFVYLLEDGRPEAVGYITACMGLAQMLVSFPAGYLADRFRRDTMLRLSSVLGCAAAGLAILATLKRSYPYLVVSLVFWGLYWGVVNTASGALFADSIKDGERAKHFTSRSVHLQAGNLAGPIICLIMFLCLGDTWTIKDCSVVLIAGQIVSVPAIALLWRFSDDATLHNESDSPPDSTPARNDEAQRQQGDHGDTTIIVDIDVDGDIDDNDDEVPRRRASSRNWLTRCANMPNHRKIPICMATADIMAGLASGMSIRYIAIFLVDNIGLSPTLVQVIYILNPLCQTALMKVAEYLAADFGRCRVAVGFKWIGISLMLAMIAAYKNDMSPWVVCGLLVARTGFMNSTRALTKSLVMDNVPRKERAKWSALESVNMFSWSGSAALGGVLVGMHGIIFNFCVTSAFQVLATLPIIALFSLDNAKSSANRTYVSVDTQSIESDSDEESNEVNENNAADSDSDEVA